MIARLLAKNISLPILEMTSVSKELQEGNFSARNTVETGDELDFLAKTINSMADSISSQIATITQVTNELYKKKDSLDLQVREKTVDLQNELKERKKAETELRKRKKKFKSLAENSQDYIVRYDEECRHLYENPAALKLSGLTEKDIIGKTHREAGLDADLSDLWAQKITKVFRTGQPSQSVFEWEDSENEVFLDWRLFPEFDESGKVLTVLSISRDITARKQAEEKIKNSLKEKEMLIQEIHHRVKNNMQLIISMLILQQQYIDETDTNLMEDVISRIRVFGDIHRKLYQQEDISKINFLQHLKENLHDLSIAAGVINILRHPFIINIDYIKFKKQMY